MRKLAFGLVAAVVFVFVLAAPAQALDCEGFTLDTGCLFTITGGDTSNPIDGYAVTNAGGVPLWDFVRDREAQAIGYPISQRWTNGPFTLQAFQKVILQWDPGKQRMNYYNTLDALANRYPHVQLPFVPPHQVLEEDVGATFGTIIRNHLALLDQNEAIKERFLREPDWLNLYGLPIRYEEREVDGHPAGVQLLRTQRTVFVVWNVPAAGVTVGRVNLQNVPDKLKKLSNVVIPDAAKLLAPAPDPVLHRAIRALPWVADGLLPHEEPTVLLLRKLFSSSQELFWTLLVERQPEWLQRSPDVLAEATLNMLLAFADIPWTRKHIGPAQPLLLSVLLNAPQEQWPSSFRKLLEKPWMRDGVTWDEMLFAESLLRFVLTTPASPGTFFGKSAELNNIISTMVDMPFLDIFEGYERDFVERSPFFGGSRSSRTGVEQVGGFEYALSIFHGFAASGGITDRQALMYSLGEPDHFAQEPVAYAAALDRRYEDQVISRQNIYLPLSGPIRLIVVHDRDQPIAHNTMAALESVLQEIVAFTKVPFPHNFFTLRVSPRVSSDFTGQYLSDHVLIDRKYVARDSMSQETRRVLVNLIARYYKGYGFPSWTTAGLSAVVEYGLGYRHPDWAPALSEFQHSPDDQVDCPVETIDGAFLTGEGACHRYIGVKFFLDLYRSLDAESFHNGLARLIVATGGRFPLYSHCWSEDPILDIPCLLPQVPPFERDFTDAFTSGATPESVDIARALIQRWFHGG